MAYIITNLMGGLGNQMFQYAAGRALSLKLNRDLYAATDHFDSCSDHNGYEINHVFNLGLRVAPHHILKSTLGLGASRKLRRIISKIPHQIPKPHAWVDELTHHKIDLNDSSSLYLHDYWQSEKFFEEYAPTIRKDFRFALPLSKKDEEIINRMKSSASASIHVRRGDYTSTKNKNIYTECDIPYYKRSAKLIEQKNPNVRFFIFSDNPKWVEQNLLNEIDNAELVTHNTGLKAPIDMQLMSSTNHQIIANSTFSWWAAWLNPAPDKIVVAPKHWFIDKNRGHSIIPSSWHKV